MRAPHTWSPAVRRAILLAAIALWVGGMTAALLLNASIGA